MSNLFEKLESIRNEIENVEFWYARDLQNLFGYSEWRNFEKAIKKAEIACKNTSESVDLHFVESNKMHLLPTGGERKVKDYALTRYACYLVAQNGDPNKEEIAFAQSYFATQTRKQELVEKRLEESERLKEREKLTNSEKVLSELVSQKNADFGYIRSKGDAALFGGNTTQQMKDKLSVPSKQPLSDYLDTPILAGKNFATIITNMNIKNKNLNSTNSIADEHSTNNEEIRNILIKRGVYPEELEAAEDVKKVKRRLASEGKKLTKPTKKG